MVAERATRFLGALLVTATMFTSSCTFHSAQLEGVKAILNSFSSDEISSRVYWWTFTYNGDAFDVLPLTWQDKTVFTDGDSWLVVIEGTKLELIRNLTLNHDFRIDYDVRNPSHDSEVSTNPSVDMSTTIRIVSETSKNLGGKKKADYLACAPQIFNIKGRSLQDECVSDTSVNTLESSVVFDASGEILSLSVDYGLHSARLERSNDEVELDSLVKDFDNFDSDGE